MKAKLLTTGLLTAALAIAPLTPASAHGWDHHDHGGGGAALGIGAAVGVLALGAAMIATAPVRVLADATAPGPVYAEPSYPAPVYAPAPGYVDAPIYGPPPASFVTPSVAIYQQPVYVRHYHPRYVYVPAYGGYVMYR
jgi:hypothetical protein